MKKIIVCTLFVSLFGVGCLRAPISTKQIPTIKPVSINERTSSLAFLRLNGGAASVTRGSDEKSAVDGTELTAGDRVQVTNGTVSLIYPDAGETRLENGTVATLTSDDGAKGLFAKLQLASGKVWTRFERLLGKGEQFSVAANGVVATVRGTAFGVAVVGEDVDIQVAENQVEVSQEVIDAAKVAEVVTVAAGEGVKVHAKTFLKRSLSDIERNSEGFRFASRKIPPERLRQSNFAPPARNIQPSGTAPTNVMPSVQGPNPSTRTQDEVSGFVKSVKTIQSADRTFDGGLIIELQHKDRFQIRNAIPVLRVGTFVDTSLGGVPDSGETDRMLFRLTRDQRAKLRGGERVWVWYNDFDLERYDFGQFDLGMLDRS